MKPKLPKLKITNWRKYALEFFSIFIAVLSAFALNNWNDNRKDAIATNKILQEISNGLLKDVDDILLNSKGHKVGLSACKFWQKIISGEEVNSDSLVYRYIALTRDFSSMQNSSGYQTLKSKGLELIENDSLRYDIISLYAYDFRTLKFLEEEYHEGQFQKNYFEDFNRIISPYLIFDQSGEIIDIAQPINLPLAEKNLLLSYILKIKYNREFSLRYYNQMETKIKKVVDRIKTELGE